MNPFGKPTLSNMETFGFRASVKIYDADPEPQGDDRGPPQNPAQLLNGVHGEDCNGVVAKPRKKKVYKPCERLLKQLAREHETTPH